MVSQSQVSSLQPDYLNEMLCDIIYRCQSYNPFNSRAKLVLFYSSLTMRSQRHDSVQRVKSNSFYSFGIEIYSHVLLFSCLSFFFVSFTHIYFILFLMNSWAHWILSVIVSGKCIKWNAIWLWHHYYNDYNS